MGINAGLFTSETPEWYTPRLIIDKVLELWGKGGIDLDPCSDPGPIFNVPAFQHFTKETSGLDNDWWGRVYMNPPYGREIGRWVEKALNESGIDELIMLLPARTDTKWFRPCWHQHICFVQGRLKFQGANNSAPFPSCLVYKGHRPLAFCRLFIDLGPITNPVSWSYNDGLLTGFQATIEK